MKSEIMFDILSLLGLSIFLPTILFALVVLIIFTYRLFIKRIKFSVIKFFKALVYTLILEVAFMFMIACFFAIALGNGLGYAYPIVVVLLTLFCGIKTFFYLLKHEVHGLSQVIGWFKKLLLLRKIIKMKY